MRHEEVEGKVKKLKGRAKEAAGIITGSSALEREGSQERAAGTVQETLGKTRRTIDEFVDGVAGAIKK